MSLRNLLKAGVLVMLMLLFLGTFLVLFRSMEPTDVNIRRHVLLVDLDQIPEGTAKRVDSAKGPVFIVHRTPADLLELERLSSQVRDPLSRASHQPPYARNIQRSIKPEWFVANGGNLRGLPVRYELLPFPGPEGWSGGFYDPYDGAMFDKAGRVFSSGHPLQENLYVPEYEFLTVNSLAIYPFGRP